MPESIFARRSFAKRSVQMGCGVALLLVILAAYLLMRR